MHAAVLLFLFSLRELHPELEHQCLNGSCFRLPQRELVAKEAERAAMELERNNAQRQHSMQCAINKTDSQRILELATQLAEAQRDAERFRFANESEEDFAICYWDENMGNGGEWMCYSDKGDAIEVLDAAIDAARGRA